MRVNASLEKINNGYLHDGTDGKRFYKNITEFLDQNRSIKDIELGNKELKIGEFVTVSIVIK